MTPEKFRGYLSSLGWTQSYFCEKTGVTPNTVSRWMTGEISKIPDWVTAYLTLAYQVSGLCDLVRKK